MRIWNFAFLTTLLLSLCPSLQAEEFPFIAEVTNEKVNVRAGQSANFERLCTLDKGDQVIVVGKDFSWYKIRLPKHAKSYISEKYVQAVNDREGEVTAMNVNVRAGADINNTIITQVSTGTRVRISEKQPGWYKIEVVEGSHGWISEDLLAFKSKDLSTFEEKISPEKGQGQPAQIESASLMDKKLQARGFLRSYKETPEQDILFELLVNDKPTFLLQGPKFILEEFQNYEVKIDGDAASTSSSPPVLVISKIELVL